MPARTLFAPAALTATGQTASFIPVSRNPTGRRRRSVFATVSGGVATARWELSDDNGTTWYALGADIGLTAGRPRDVQCLDLPFNNVLMRLNVTAYTSGNVTPKVTTGD